MGFGGSSLSHCAAPFPAPFPPAAAAAAATSSSSSSTLSPLAPPFTVDRAAPRPALPYDPYPSPWPPRTHPSDDYLHRRPPSPSPPPPGSPPRPAHGVTAAALPFYGHGGSSGEAASRRNPNLARADPYYPRCSSAAGTAVRDERGFYGGRQEGSVFGVGAPAEGVGGSSLWMERENAAVAPGYRLGFQQDASIAPGFVAYEDLQGDWHGKLTESPSGKDHFKYEHLDWLDVGNNTGVTSDLSGTSSLVPCTSVGVCYPQSSEMHTFVEGSKSSDFNSPYDRYICQANTERTDPRVFYPATTHFPAKVCATTSSASTSVDKCRLKNVNHVQHVNAYKNDMLHGGHLSIRSKEPSINLNFEDKEDYAGMNRGEDTIKNDYAKVNSSVMKITLPPSMESAKQISQNYSLRKKSDLRIANLNAPGPVECDREQSSSERLDENPSEDSPCWKGAPSSRHSVSDTFNTLVGSYAIGDQKFGGPHKRASDHPKVENEVVALLSSGLRKDRNIVMPSEDRRNGFESKNVNEMLAVNEENNRTSAKNKLITGIANHCIDPTQGDSSSFFSLANDQLSFACNAVTDPSSRRRKSPVIYDPSSSALGIDAQVLVKTIHNLSELLLSSCHFDANLLKEHDKELVASAVNNLDMCISRKSEFGIMRSELFCHSDGYPHSRLPVLSEDVPKGGCQATGPEFIDRGVEQSNNRSICSEQEKMHSISPNVSSHKFGNFLSTCDGSNLKKLSEKAMHEMIYVQGENPQSAPFESLWFDVEDAVCLLKYRLQLLRSNIVTDNSNQQVIEDVERDASNVLKLSSQKYKNSVTEEHMPPWKSTDSLLKNLPPEGKHENLDNFEKPQLTISSGSGSKVDDMDASVMARFKVLKCRIDNLDAVDVEGQHGQLNSLKAVNNSEIHENICGPCPSDGKRNSAMEFQPVNPAGWGYQHPFHSGVAEGEVSGRSSVQHHLTDYIGELSLSAHFSDHRVSERFCAQDVGGLANQSYVPDRRSGKHLITGVHDGSSDWEHVTEEEVTW